MRKLKQKFGTALTALAEEHELSEITIQDLCEACGASVQSFYYCFDAVEDAAEWVFQQAADEIAGEADELNSWGHCLRRIMYWLRSRRLFVLSTYRSEHRGEIETFLYAALTPYLAVSMKNHAELLNVTKEQRRTIERYFTVSFSAVVFDWIGRGMMDDPDDLVDQVELIARGGIGNALHNYHVNNEAARRKTGGTQ